MKHSTQVASKREGRKYTTDTEGLGNETPRSSIAPSTAENTIGYTSTNEAVPMTVFYRNDSSKRNGGKNSLKSRPTLHQLRKNFEKDGNITSDTEAQAQVKHVELMYCFQHKLLIRIYYISKLLKASKFTDMINLRQA